MTKLGSRVQGNGPQTYFRLRLRVSSSSHINQHPILFPILSPLKGSPTAGIRAFLFKPREEKQFTKKVIHFKLSWTNSSDWVMSHLRERIPREAGFQWSPWILVLSLCLTILCLILYMTVCKEWLIATLFQLGCQRGITFQAVIRFSVSSLPELLQGGSFSCTSLRDAALGSQHLQTGSRGELGPGGAFAVSHW